MATSFLARGAARQHRGAADAGGGAAPGKGRCASARIGTFSVGPAKLQLIGAVTQALYVSTLRGALAVLPMPLAPEHIKVLVSKCETVMETV